MTLTQLVRTVLDDAYESIEAASAAEKDKLIKAEIEGLTESYERLTDPSRPDIDYSRPEVRFAYIYKYTVAHADYIKQIIEKCDTLKQALQQEQVRVSCVGGGPGSDLLGILKFMLMEKTTTEFLSCKIVDRESAWADSWDGVSIKITAPFRVDTSFFPIDATDSATWRHQKKFMQSDLFTMSYFVSELWTQWRKSEQFFLDLISSMHSDALVLYVDNGDSRFTDVFDAVAGGSGLTVIKSGAKELAFGSEEEKRDLGPYLAKFGWPKRKSKVAFRILKKS